MTEPKSYIGILSKHDGWLIGGVKEHRSARFTTFTQALDWCRIIWQSNVSSGRYPDRVCVDASNREPEIKF